MDEDFQEVYEKINEERTLKVIHSGIVSKDKKTSFTAEPYDPEKVNHVFFFIC